MGYVPASSEYLRKSSWNVTDNFTKIYRTHTIKAGVYAEQARNNNVLSEARRTGISSSIVTKGASKTKQRPATA